MRLFRWQMPVSNHSSFERQLPQRHGLFRKRCNNPHRSVCRLKTIRPATTSFHRTLGKRQYPNQLGWPHRFQCWPGFRWLTRSHSIAETSNHLFLYSITKLRKIFKNTDGKHSRQEPSRGHKFSIAENSCSLWNSFLLGRAVPQTLRRESAINGKLLIFWIQSKLFQFFFVFDVFISFLSGDSTVCFFNTIFHCPLDNKIQRNQNNDCGSTADS